MRSHSFSDRWRAVVSALAVAFAFASFPTQVSAQAELEYYPPGVFAFGPSADGSTIIGVDTRDGFFAFAIRDEVVTLFDLGGGFSYFGGSVSDDGMTVVGTSATADGVRRGFVWHPGDQAPTPLPLAGNYGTGFGVSADGSSVFGEDWYTRFIEFFTLDLPLAYVIRDGVKTTFDFGGHASTMTWVTRDGATIVGAAETAPGDITENAFIWRAGHGAATLLPGGYSARPNAISENGLIVGHRSQFFSPVRALVWTDFTQPPLQIANMGRDSSAQYVSPNGTTVVGTVGQFNGLSKGFVWRVGDSEATELTLGGTQSSVAFPSADGSTVVGRSELPSGLWRGFVWRNGVIQALPQVAGFESSGATWISADGRRIIGEAFNGPSPGNFVTREIVLWDLNRPPVLLRDRLVELGLTPDTTHFSRTYGVTPDLRVLVGEFFERTPSGDNSGTFRVVLPPLTPLWLLQELIGKVQSLGLHHGIENSLVVKLNAAVAALDQGDAATAVTKLNDFINQVNAQSGNQIPVEAAAALIAAAQEILELLDD
jgi:uncharacterized membrane protein